MERVDINVFLKHNRIFHLIHTYVLTGGVITLKNENFVIIVGGRCLFGNDNSEHSSKTGMNKIVNEKYHDELYSHFSSSCSLHPIIHLGLYKRLGI